jgi:hypothetical protein
MLFSRIDTLKEFLRYVTCIIYIVYRIEGRALYLRLCFSVKNLFLINKWIRREERKQSNIYVC